MSRTKKSKARARRREHLQPDYVPPREGGYWTEKEYRARQAHEPKPHKSIRNALMRGICDPVAFPKMRKYILAKLRARNAYLYGPVETWMKHAMDELRHAFRINGAPIPAEFEETA